MGDEMESSCGPSQPIYTRSQLEQFLEYIELPRVLHFADPTPFLLTQLHAHCIARIPYENLSLHYNSSHSINLDPQFLFDKMVTQARGRGGYCMEVAMVYHHVLKGLGFQVYTAPAKNRNRIDGVPTGDWRSWVHIVNIVTFQNASEPQLVKYSSDIAFGGDGPSLPMPLEPELVHVNLGSQEIRLARDWLADQTWRPAGDEGDRLKYWIYQYRNSPQKPWNSFAAFLEMEFTPTDWDRVNLFTSDPTFVHAQQVIVVKFLGRKDRPESEVEIYGKRMLVDGVVKENLRGKTHVIFECQTESDRVEALRKYFDMDLTQEERSGIIGYRTELKSQEQPS